MEDNSLNGFYTALREMVENGGDFESSADKLLDVPEYRLSIVRVVASRARLLQRQATKAAEQRAAIDMRKAEESTRNGNRAASITPLRSAKATLVGHTFALPDGHLVDWGAATVQQHKARAGWFRRQADGLSTTASIHELAARVIEESGVACLNEIESIEVFPELAAVMNGEKAG